MKEIIEKIRASLNWRIIETVDATRPMEIATDPWQKTHTIYLPPPGAEWRDIEYLHELAHAHLAETVHPLFSGAHFAEGISDKDISPFVYPKCAADDWFVDHLLMRWCPDAERAEIAEHVALVAQAPPSRDPFWLFGAGLMFAQAVEYRVKHPPIPRELAPVVKILRSIRPANPNLRNLRRLTNRLAALVTRKQLAVVSENGVDVWRIE